MRSAIDYPMGYSTTLFMPTSSGIMDDSWRSAYDRGSFFGDARREASFQWLSNRIDERQSCVINAITNGDSERKRAERLLNNAHLDVRAVIERCCLPVGDNCLKGEVLLNIIDQTTITFADAVGRQIGQDQPLGIVGNGFHYGQNCVAGLMVQKSSLKVLGLSSLSFYSRDEQGTSSRDHRGRDNRPLKYRNPHKWVDAVEQANFRAIDARQLIHVIDREGDDMNVLAQILLSKAEAVNKRALETHVLIRAKENRSVHLLTDSSRSGKIRSFLEQVPPVACYCVEITDDERMSFSATYTGPSKGRTVKRIRKRKGRRAMLEMRYLSCRMDMAHLKKTKSDMSTAHLDELFAKSDIGHQILTYVHLREVDEKGRPVSLNQNSTGKSSEAVDWLILTTLPVNSTADALEVVDIYRQRFRLIEQLFRGLKTDGFNIEVAQQQSVKALQILTAMAMKGSTLLMKMIGARDQDEGYAIENDFTQREIEVLQLCLQQYEGKTNLQANPHSATQLSWAVWIIARIGGWKPGNVKRPPGPKTLQRGLEKFYTIYQGVALAKEWEPDVSQP